VSIYVIGRSERTKDGKTEYRNDVSQVISSVQAA